MMESLIDKGHAYAAADGSGDVYFDVRSWPAYGELTHQRVDDMVDAEDADPRGKRDPRDFALWKGRKPERAGDRVVAHAVRRRAGPAGTSSARRWPASTSATTFDVHGGGVDLRFPHHENEHGPVARGRPRLRELLAAQRLGDHGRREDEQVARQLAAGQRGRQGAPARSPCATTSRPRTTAR